MDAEKLAWRCFFATMILASAGAIIFLWYWGWIAPNFGVGRRTGLVFAGAGTVIIAPALFGLVLLFRASGR